MESANSQDHITATFKRFNAILLVLLDAFPEVEHNSMVLDAVKKLRPYERFTAYLSSATSVHDLIKGYKTAILQELAVFIRRRDGLERSDKVLDAELIARYLPEPLSQKSEAKRREFYSTLQE